MNLECSLEYVSNLFWPPISFSVSFWDVRNIFSVMCNSSHLLRSSDATIIIQTITICEDSLFRCRFFFFFGEELMSVLIFIIV